MIHYARLIIFSANAEQHWHLSFVSLISPRRNNFRHNLYALKLIISINERNRKENTARKKERKGVGKSPRLGLEGRRKQEATLPSLTNATRLAALLLSAAQVQMILPPSSHDGVPHLLTTHREHSIHHREIDLVTRDFPNTCASTGSLTEWKIAPTTSLAPNN